IVQAAVEREGGVERRRARGGVAPAEPALAAGGEGELFGGAASAHPARLEPALAELVDPAVEGVVVGPAGAPGAPRDGDHREARRGAPAGDDRQPGREAPGRGAAAGHEAELDEIGHDAAEAPRSSAGATRRAARRSCRSRTW